MELSLLRLSRRGVGAGVGVDIFSQESESQLESLEIRRLRSPGSYCVFHKMPDSSRQYLLKDMVHVN